MQRVQLENLNKSTSEYLETHQPANSRSAIQTAMNALKQVVSEVHPEETETFEEMSEEKLVDYLELFSSAFSNRTVIKKKILSKNMIV